MGLEMPACSAISSIDTAWKPRLAKAAPATASIWRSRSSRGMRGRKVGPCRAPDAVVLKLAICYSGVTYSRVTRFYKRERAEHDLRVRRPDDGAEQDR